MKKAQRLIFPDIIWFLVLKRPTRLQNIVERKRLELKLTIVDIHLKL